MSLEGASQCLVLETPVSLLHHCTLPFLVILQGNHSLSRFMGTDKDSGPRFFSLVRGRESFYLCVLEGERDGQCDVAGPGLLGVFMV